MEPIQTFAFLLVGLACLLFCAALAERLAANLRVRSWTGAVVALVVLAASLFCFWVCFESGAIPSEMRAALWFAHARGAEGAYAIPPDLFRKVQDFLFRNGWFELAGMVGFLCLFPAILVSFGIERAPALSWVERFRAGAALRAFWSWYRGLWDAHRLLLTLVSLLYLATALAATGSLADENRELVRETNR